MRESGRTERVVRLADGREVIERSDGSRRPLEDRTDWAKVDATTEADIARQIAEDPDDPGNDPDFWERAKVVYPPPKERITVRLDADVLAWLKAQGPGYQTRLNAILRGYMEHALKGR